MNPPLLPLLLMIIILYRKDFGTEINTKRWNHRINIIGGATITGN